MNLYFLQQNVTSTTEMPYNSNEEGQKSFLKKGCEIMERITNYNCDGLCAETTCNKKYTQMERVTINGIEMIVAMCDKHANNWEDYSWKHSGKLGKLFPSNKHKVMLHEFV